MVPKPWIPDLFAKAGAGVVQPAVSIHNGHRGLRPLSREPACVRKSITPDRGFRILIRVLGFRRDFFEVLSEVWSQKK
jgi:hypothetical protein